jgi:hypothetical protein
MLYIDGYTVRWYYIRVKVVIFLAYDEKAKERTIRYMKDKRDKLTLNLPAGDKERYKAHAEQRNMSLTGLIVDLLEKDIQDLNK